MAARIHQGDCVWDIGANVGYYTSSYAEKAGPDGEVVAFEPSPENFALLQQSVSSIPTVQCLHCGLGKTVGQMSIEQGEDRLGTMSKVSYDTSAGPTVTIETGDHLVGDGTLRQPTVIKIDVEGFEWEVLQGCERLLANKELRVIGIEIHFGILDSNDQSDVPKQIERALKNAGFTANWPDSSHIVAERN